MKRLLADENGIATILVVIFIILGVIVVGVVGTAAFFLSDDVSITVTNLSCGTLDIAKGTAALDLNFLPGINLPAEIAQGNTAIIQIPRRLVDSVSIGNSSVEIHAFSRSYTFGTSRIDMQRSTLDGTSLSGFIGGQIDISRDHTLVLECK
jgi:hypothetical protein